ncbi:LacI family DNA-binding transcriptional regulator [Altererythrobacter indicus]|uniref:LacI family DNA-binding transcriptional regulator n=1 Tax=Altericroceibacterium indicum TaxID=374177 RepID=A0A845ABG8_9SPHN|nr:LacI family DNA-binding transcriptional regulator [Altericroceibacterium indicum]MXP26593.1 LacI family DNA-binding transcriptional regulator [Altericroceibacterium indicum]
MKRTTGMGRVTIRDIAAHAGTSFKTVSRVVNGEDSVSPALRQKVQEAMKALGYRPSRAAQTLRSGRHFALCVLSAVALEESFAGDEVPSFLNELIAGLMRACRAQNYQLVLENLAGTDSSPETIQARIASLRADGVILYPPQTDMIWLLDALELAGIPYARIAPGSAPERADCYLVDDFNAAREVGELLLSQGHSRIAFISGPENHLAAAHRREGLQAALAGRPNVELQCEVGTFHFPSGLAIGKKLLIQQTRPTAIFAANDMMALGVMAAASELGIVVPEQLSVVGFDDAPQARFIRPELTSINQNVREMGEMAGKMLIETSREKAAVAPRQHHIPYTLEIRQSVGRAPD